MRTYRVEGPHTAALFVTVEARGKQLARDCNGSSRAVDVPTTKAELVGFLNDLAADQFGRRPGLEIELPEEEPETQLSGRFDGPRVAGFCDACGRSAAGSLKLAQGNDISTIEQWMETAELWAIQQLVERARDVVRGRSEALDGKGVQ